MSLSISNSTIYSSVQSPFFSAYTPNEPPFGSKRMVWQKLLSENSERTMYITCSHEKGICYGSTYMKLYKMQCDYTIYLQKQDFPDADAIRLELCYSHQDSFTQEMIFITQAISEKWVSICFNLSSIKFSSGSQRHEARLVLSQGPDTYISETLAIFRENCSSATIDYVTPFPLKRKAPDTSIKPLTRELSQLSGEQSCMLKTAVRNKIKRKSLTDSTPSTSRRWDLRIANFQNKTLSKPFLG